MSKVMDVLLKHGKITQERYDGIIMKENAKFAAIEKYKKDGAKLTKLELMAILDKLKE